MISFGHHSVEIGLLLRESVFLSSILYNMEVWYGMSSDEVGELEKLDLILIRKILRVPKTTPKASLYLEFGIVPMESTSERGLGHNS